MVKTCQWAGRSNGAADAPPLIDTSTPESLERDFYAWLWGMPKMEDNDSASDRSTSACSSDFPNNNSVDNYVDYNYGSYEEEPFSFGAWQMSPFPTNYGSIGSAGGTTVDANNNDTCDHFDNGEMKINFKKNNSNNNNKPRKSTGKSNCHNKCAGTNQLGRTYSPGLPLSMCERERIVDLYRSGWKICDISKQLCVTHSCVSKILHRFRTTGTCRPKDAKEGRQESPLVEAIRDYRTRLGLTRQSEIREQLIRDGWCQHDSAPSRSSINHILRTKLDVRKRKK